MSLFDELAERRTLLAAACKRPDRAVDLHVDLDGDIDSDIDVDRYGAAARRDREAAAHERRRAASDRRRAAEYLAATYRDETTGALSRRPGWEQLLAEVERAHRTSAGLALVFVDVDGLKGVNDRYGHRRGDELLAAVGLALRSSLRPYDVIVRYGGDEFICALPGSVSATAETSIARAGHRLAVLITGATLSVGHAELSPDDTLDDLVRRADADLYQRRSHFRHGVQRPNRSDLAPLPRPDAACCEHQAPSVSCGACGDAIPLQDFRIVDVRRATREGTCPRCGRQTLIQLG